MYKEWYEHLSIMCNMRMIETKDHTIIFSKVSPDSSHKVSNIVRWFKNIHHISFIDWYYYFFFNFIKGNTANMIFQKLSNVFFMYFMKDSFDIFFHIQEKVIIISWETFSNDQKEISFLFPFSQNLFLAPSWSSYLRASLCCRKSP